jgi:hypothetical protein
LDQITKNSLAAFCKPTKNSLAAFCFRARPSSEFSTSFVHDLALDPSQVSYTTLLWIERTDGMVAFPMTCTPGVFFLVSHDEN